jgi:hypothetical protein
MGNLRRRKDRLEKKITFRIDENRLEELENFALFEGMPVSFIVRHLVVRFLEDRRRHPLQVNQMHGLEQRP